MTSTINFIDMRTFWGKDLAARPSKLWFLPVHHEIVGPRHGRSEPIGSLRSLDTKLCKVPATIPELWTKDFHQEQSGSWFFRCSLHIRIDLLLYRPTAVLTLTRRYQLTLFFLFYPEYWLWVFFHQNSDRPPSRPSPQEHEWVQAEPTRVHVSTNKASPHKPAWVWTSPNGVERGVEWGCGCGRGLTKCACSHQRMGGVGAFITFYQVMSFLLARCDAQMCFAPRFSNADKYQWDSRLFDGGIA